MPAGTQFVDEDDDDDDLDDNSKLVKDLRKQLKEGSKREAELTKQLGELSTKERQRTLTEALGAKGLPAKAAKFYPADAELTDEAIDTWIGDNADVFGVTPNETTPTPGSGESDTDTSGEQAAFDPSSEAAYRRLAAARLVGGTATTREQDVLRQIAESKNPEELTAFLRQARA